MDLEQKHHQETLKEVRKHDRRLKELSFQTDEDKKNQNRLQDLVEKLQYKLKVYKKQIDETEQISATNLGKLRKAQLDLENAEERAGQAENLLNKTKVKPNSSSFDRFSPQVNI